MSKKKNLCLKVLSTAGIILIGMECVNQLLFRLATKKAEAPAEEQIHRWKKGNFYFEKRENQNKENQNGSPILILHDLSPDQSSESCSQLADQLSQKRTVYLMDLLGCGRSDKPAITYIHYLYVLQVEELIDHIAGEPVHLVAYGRSADIAVAAAHNQPEKITQLSLIDPQWEDSGKTPDQKSRLIKRLIEMPVIGTFLYNMTFKMNQNAHLGGPNARYLFASIAGNFTNWNTSWMLENMKTPIHVIMTDEDANVDTEGENA